MKTYSRHDIGISLDKWIDTKTGEFYRPVRKSDPKAVEFLEALHEGIAYIFDLCKPNDYMPCGKSSGVDIKFCDEHKVSLQGRSGEFPVRGEFTPSRSRKPGTIGTITLYNKTIAEFCNANGLDYTTVFWSTLARYAFHALHYSRFSFRGFPKYWDSGADKKDRDIVKESLAAATEYIFLINQEGDGLDLDCARRMQKHLENTWRMLCHPKGP